MVQLLLGDVSVTVAALIDALIVGSVYQFRHCDCVCYAAVEYPSFKGVRWCHVDATLHVALALTGRHQSLLSHGR